MPLNTYATSPDVPLEDHGTAIFSLLKSQWYRVNGSLFYLTYLTYLINS